MENYTSELNVIKIHLGNLNASHILWLERNQYSELDKIEISKRFIEDYKYYINLKNKFNINYGYINLKEPQVYYHKYIVLAVYIFYDSSI